MNFSIVTFCTPEYQDCIEHLKNKCAELDIGYKNLLIDSTGDWASNTRLKPASLLLLRQITRGPVLYLDVDSLLVSRPRCPEHNDWDVGIINNPRVEHVNKIASQCFWLNDTPAALKLLIRWNHLVETQKRLDHPCLTLAIKHFEFTKQARITFMDDTVDNCWKFNGQRPERSQTTRALA